MSSGGRNVHFSGNGKWKGVSVDHLSEQERKQIEDEIKREGGIDYESGDGSLLYRARVHGQLAR